MIFVAPPPEARITGGNLYNLGLCAALVAAGERVELLTPALALARTPGRCYVDSLHLEAVAPLAARGWRVWLLAHWLPSLVRGGPPDATDRAALAALSAAVAPSAYMARALAALGVARAHVVAPARPTPLPRAAAGPVLRALLVANLVEGKGVLQFLEQLPAAAPLALEVIGSHDDDRAYAAACVARAATLGGAVRLRGPLAHADTLAQIAAADVLLSASRMESYGLALSEARALGVPILARAGGNAAAHVEAAAGGQLVDDAAALAAACLQLARDPDERARRRAAAQAACPPPRSWAEAARDFLAAARAE